MYNTVYIWTPDAPDEYGAFSGEEEIATQEEIIKDEEDGNTNQRIG